ncbi:MAG: peroxide stress protein YaaA [Burkholderiales bacterium]|nr:peroxide stress protein YaaA [Burkholderiales bacterium]
MLLLVSPAKTLDYETAVPRALAARATEPLFTPRAAELVGVLRKKKAAQVAKLMDLSSKLAELNVQRYAAWSPAATPDNSRPAAWAFAGDVYEGLQAHTLKAADWTWAQRHLVILSGLYGVLRPLDRLQPYRLEMGTALRVKRTKDLYGYWGDTLAEHLNERQAEEAEPVVVNLASIEYGRAALRKALRARVVDCVFEDWKGGGYKVISFFAKQARGMMARHAIVKRATKPQQLEDFATGGYALDRGASEPDRLVFRRR